MLTTTTTTRQENKVRYDGDMAKAKILDIKALAEHLGLGVASVRTYNGTANMHRRKAAETGDKSYIRPGDLPEPDGYAGQAPYWFEATINKWQETRPGQGGYNKESHKRRLLAESRKAKAQAGN